MQAAPGNIMNESGPMFRWVWRLAAMIWLGSLPARPQTVVTVENLGIVNATQMVNGLGFNLNPLNDWEFQMAKAAGATEVRIQCGWGAVELQTAQNTSGGYVMPTVCVNALASAAKYGLQPLVIAAYGPPYRAIVTLKTTADVPVGSYKIPVVATNGTMSQINVPYCHVYESNQTQLTAQTKWAYEGALISAVDLTGGTISLAAKTAIDVPAGTLLTVNQVLYPSVATTDPAEPSIVAYAGPTGPRYGGYVGFLAKSISDLGLTGRVEIWNEPPWPHDPWDQRFRFYDAKIPSNLSTAGDQAGFVAALETQTPPGNVRYAWGGPHKTGFNSLFSTRNPHPTQAESAASFTSEEFHPYGNDPEDNGWDPTCLALLNGWVQCNLAGTDPNGNIKAAAQYNLQNIASYGWGIEQDISETGTLTTNQVTKARYIMRQFVMYQGLGIKKIDFFLLADAGANFGFIDTSTPTPTAGQAYTAISGFMKDVQGISGTASPKFSASNLSSVVSYAGYYPLSVVQVTGTTSNIPSSNAMLVNAWQRSIVSSSGSSSWLTLTSPQPVPVTVQIPAGMKPVSATNLTLRSDVPFTTSGSKVTFNVTDDPVSLKLAPIPSLMLTAASPSLTVVAGSGQANTDMLTVVAAGGLTGAVSFGCTVSYSGGSAVTSAPACSLTAPAVTLADGGSGNTTLSLSTVAPHAVKTGPLDAQPRERAASRYAFAIVLPLLALCLRRRSRRGYGILHALFASVLVAAISGCGNRRNHAGLLHHRRHSRRSQRRGTGYNDRFYRLDDSIDRFPRG
jgi:hypothetical protein